MKTYSDKTCKHCAILFTPTGPNSVFCSRKCKQKDRWASYRKERELAGEPLGAHGGNHGRPGWNVHLTVTGLERFRRKLRHELHDSVRYCERCQVDLKDVSPGFWCAHHRDHDRSHNEMSNLELLCKRCHQIEHRCHEAFAA